MASASSVYRRRVREGRRRVQPDGGADHQERGGGVAGGAMRGPGAERQQSGQQRRLRAGAGRRPDAGRPPAGRGAARTQRPDGALQGAASRMSGKPLFSRCSPISFLLLLIFHPILSYFFLFCIPTLHYHFIFYCCFFNALFSIMLGTVRHLTAGP